MMVLARRVGAEMQLHSVTADDISDVPIMKLWSYVLDNEVSTSGVFLWDVSSMSRLVV